MSSAGLIWGADRISGDIDCGGKWDVCSIEEYILDIPTAGAISVGQFSSNLWTCLVHWLGDVVRVIARGEAHAGVR